jgi:prepilin-type N-terminal cleavage/methylation domain-containing protein
VSSLRNRSGFSLVELAVTVLIAGLILAFSVPAFNRYMTGQNVRNSAGILAGEMQLARARAVSTNNRVWVWYSTGYTWYWIGEQPYLGNNTWGGVTWRGPISLPKRVKIATADFGGLNYLWYGPDGRPTGAGSATFVSTVATPDTAAVFVDLSGSVWR